MPGSSPLKIAVIGGGNIAQQHLPVLADVPEAEVVSLVDAEDRTREETADRFGISGRYRSHQELLEMDPPDAVFVLVSVLQVAPVSADFLRARIPTFLEKPPGLYASDTRTLAELSRETETLAMVGLNRRFYSTQLRGREALASVGSIQSVTVEAHEDISRVRVNPKFPEEVMARWSAANGIHALDLLRFFGGDVAEIQAFRQTVVGPMPDCLSAVLTFENGAMGRALLDWFAPGNHRYEVRCEGATLTSSPGFSNVTLNRGGEREVIEPDDQDLRYKAGFYRQDQTFLQCVLDHKPLPFPACDLDDALKSMEMIETISGV